MLDGMRMATEGLLNMSVKQDIITNNLANVGTAGFRKESMVMESFSDVMAREMSSGGAGEVHGSGGMENRSQIYHKSVTHGGQGAIKETGNPFDMALDDNGKGFFTVQNNQKGTMEFTRAGTFRLSKEGFVCTADGGFLMGQNGPLQLKGGTDFKISDEGVVSMDGKEVDRLLISVPDDAREIQRQGATAFVATGPGMKATNDFKVKQGYVEQANFNALTEMVELMQVSKNFEANQKALQSHDQRLQKAVNELGRVR
jgi:flagellar basal-body rod protein FlgF